MQIKNGTFCPLIKEDCVQLKCAWFIQLRGKNPNTGQDVDEWLCSISALPMLQVEVAKETRQGAAATESFRNEMVKANQQNSVVNVLLNKRIAAVQEQGLLGTTASDGGENGG
jgi:hypothetical protein